MQGKSNTKKDKKRQNQDFRILPLSVILGSECKAGGVDLCSMAILIMNIVNM